MRYLVSRAKMLRIVRADGSDAGVEASVFGEAIRLFNERVEKLADFDIDISRLLGMRNLSAFVGELYGACAIKAADGLFRKNPHQDGYPDLLVMDTTGRKSWESLAGKLRDKKPFSPFLAGGIEIKASVGSVPAPDWFQKRNMQKPDIGDQRIEYLRGYDWKAHHRGTNNLLGLLWDFIGGVPRIAAVFYSPNLTPDSWGEIIQPRAGGGNTTSVSIMTRQGVRQMYDGWLYALDEAAYTVFLNRHNRAEQIQADLASGAVEL